MRLRQHFRKTHSFCRPQFSFLSNALSLKNRSIVSNYESVFVISPSTYLKKPTLLYIFVIVIVVLNTCAPVVFWITF